MSHAMQGHSRRIGHGREFGQNVVHWRRKWETTSAFLPWEPQEQDEKNNSVLEMCIHTLFEKGPTAKQYAAMV